MLVLTSDEVNICELSKLLVKHKIKARITNQAIYIDGDASSEVLNLLCASVRIKGVRNFDGDTEYMMLSRYLKPTPIVSAEKNVSEQHSDSFEIKEDLPLTTDMDDFSQEIENRPSDQANSPIVKRGQVWFCDLGVRSGSVVSQVRPVIIVQNDIGNLHSTTTIVIPCTSKNKHRHYPTNFRFKFSDETMVDYNNNAVHLRLETCVAMAEQIQTVSKSQLLKYSGTMRDEFMDELAHFINVSLSLPNEHNKVEPKHYKIVSEPIKIVELRNEPAKEVTRPQPVIDAPVVNASNTTTPKPKKKKTKFKKDSNYNPSEKQISKIKQEPPKPVPVRQSVEELDEVQRELLRFANLTDVYNICSDAMSDEEKVNILLEIFGFDSTKRGVDLLNDAIFASLRCSYYNLETLSNLVHKIHSEIIPAEIQRLIVARVKENFKFKKAPTSDFIRLINNLIKTKGELLNEQTHI